MQRAVDFAESPALNGVDQRTYPRMVRRRLGDMPGIPLAALGDMSRGASFTDVDDRAREELVTGAGQVTGLGQPFECLAEPAVEVRLRQTEMHAANVGGEAAEPVRLALPSGRTIVEFPLTTFAWGPLRMPVAGGGYLRLLPFTLLRWGIGRLVAAGRPTVLYVHNWEIDADQPRQQVPALVRWNHYHNLERVEDRLRALLEQARYSTLRDVIGALDRDARLATEPLSAVA